MPATSKTPLVGFSLSGTGLSLGGFLAKMFSLFGARKGLNIPVIAFESPGSLEMMEKLQSNLQSSKVDLAALNIQTYQMSPNIINTANHHVGKVYCLDFPEKRIMKKQDQALKQMHEKDEELLKKNKKDAGWGEEFGNALLAAVRQVVEAIKQAKNMAKGAGKEFVYRGDAIVSTLMFHPMNSVLAKLMEHKQDQFTKVTPMSNWPALTRVDKEQGGVLAAAFNHVPNSLLLQSLLLLQDYWNGKITDKQVAAARKIIMQKDNGSNPGLNKFIKDFVAHLGKSKTNDGYTLDIAHNEIDQRLYGLYNNRRNVQSMLKDVTGEVRMQFKD
jgi:hypothetical protein